MKIKKDEKDKFHSLVDSLKKCRRADLSDINDDEDIIEKLYVDPLDNDFVLNSCLKANTTILIGRKGTGKSTIMARVQREIRKDSKKVAIYLDVKTIFEQSKTAFPYDSGQYHNLMQREDLEKYLLCKSFLKYVIEQIKVEVKTNSMRFFLAKITSAFGPDKKTFEQEVENIFSEINKDEFIDIEILKKHNLQKTEKQSNRNSVGVQVGINSILESDAKIKLDQVENNSEKIDHQIQEILLRCFDPKVIMTSIKNLLEKIGIKYAVICLDDFSEIDEIPMKVFVDTIVSPLNNWSDDFFKFKIAAYPGRIYMGDLDPQKLEQIKLDYYDLFQSTKVTDTQAYAQENVKKLITKRLFYFCKEDASYFFDTSKNQLDDYYKILFEASSGVPRNIGWILWYAYQSSIAKDVKINLRVLELAAEKYYVDSIAPYFSQNKFMREPFTVKLEKYHLKDLLDEVIKNSKLNKKEIQVSESKVFSLDKEKPLSSHFYIDSNFEQFLSALELNFFITKYNEQKDQDSQNVMSFFSLNYGLCVREDINFGRGSDRKYVIQRRFNYSEAVSKYISSAKQIVCQNNKCNKIHSFEILSNLQMFGMLCPLCRIGTCIVEQVSVDLPIVADEILIDEFSLSMMNSLKIEEPQYPTSLAQEIDTTYQKVTRKGIRLRDLGLIRSEKQTLDINLGERTYYYLTEKARNVYFKT